MIFICCEFLLQGLVALVTGGASGLGRATVQRLVKNGAKVALLDLPQSDGKKIEAELGDNCIFTPANVTSFQEVQDAMKIVQSKYGRLDATVHCAGICYAFKLYSIVRKVMCNLEMIKKTIDVNILGTMNVNLCSIQVMGENKKDESGHRGVIINTSSIAAYDGQVGQAVYAATKGAVVSMTLPFARDYADDGIRFLAIAPGLFDTPLLASLPEKARNFLCTLVPMPSRLGNPDEFAALVQHLIENQYMNGEVIRLDGALRMPP
uniref:3-hydroxyacyl-CoA dehydrogenase type-2 n=1 Tax=Syphacia muris TaxID=451379 RepID=A0A0N5AUW4_9BILA